MKIISVTYFTEQPQDTSLFRSRLIFEISSENKTLHFCLLQLLFCIRIFFISNNLIILCYSAFENKKPKRKFVISIILKAFVFISMSPHNIVIYYNQQFCIRTNLYPNPYIITKRMNKTQQQLKVNQIEGHHRQQNHLSKIISSIEDEIFQHLQLDAKYKVNEIQVMKGEILKTIFIQSKTQTNVTFYLGHGFGGTSLMYFPLFPQLIKKGNIVLWQIRGMGLALQKQYPLLSQQQVEQFYIQGLQAIFHFYKHQKITFISHSFGAYITLLFTLKHSKQFNIEKCLLLSPIGITPKEKDYKNKIDNFLDIFHHSYSWLGWKFNISYKTILSRLHDYLKIKLIKNSLQKFDLNEKDLEKMVSLFGILTQIPGGSQKYFYKTILPRVLPMHKKSIQQLFEKNQIQSKVIFYYGGKNDWVDKQGAQYLSSKYRNFDIKILQQCGHMLPLHTSSIKIALLEELSKQY